MGVTRQAGELTESSAWGAVARQAHQHRYTRCLRGSISGKSGEASGIKTAGTFVSLAVGELSLAMASRNRMSRLQQFAGAEPRRPRNPGVKAWAAGKYPVSRLRGHVD